MTTTPGCICEPPVFPTTGDLNLALAVELTLVIFEEMHLRGLHIRAQKQGRCGGAFHGYAVSPRRTCASLHRLNASRHPTQHRPRPCVPLCACATQPALDQPSVRARVLAPESAVGAYRRSAHGRLRHEGLLAQPRAHDLRRDGAHTWTVSQDGGRTRRPPVQSCTCTQCGPGGRCTQDFYRWVRAVQPAVAAV